MRLPSAKVENAVAKGESRPSLMYVHFDRENNCLAAANGFVMLVAPVDPLYYVGEDVTGPISVEAIKEARKRKCDIHALSDKLNLVSGVGELAVMSLPRPGLEYPFPDYLTLIKGWVHPWTVALLNRDYLRGMLQALEVMDEKDATLSLGINLQKGSYEYSLGPVEIRQRGGEKAAAYVMPMTEEYGSPGEVADRMTTLDELRIALADALVAGELGKDGEFVLSYEFAVKLAGAFGIEVPDVG